jgi:putative phage-type endonuclease
MIPHSEEWHAERRKGIGGSDAPAVLGLSTWATPYRIWCEKLGAPIEPVEETEVMRWGRALEPLVLGRYCEITGHAVIHPEFIRNSIHPWLFCNPDAVTVGNRLVEVKTANTFAEGWGEPGTDEIPEPYLVQVHHSLIATGLRIADVAVLIGGSDFRIYTVEPDPDIHAAIIERETEFWDRVQRREPPDPVDLSDAKARWGRISTKGHVRATGRALDAWRAACEHREAIAIGKDCLDSCRLTLMEELADHGDTLVGPDGEVLATWKLNVGRKGYTVAPSPPSRSLLIKEPKA